MGIWIKRGRGTLEYQDGEKGYLGSVWKQDFFWTAHALDHGENKGWFWTKQRAKTWVIRTVKEAQDG